MKLSKTALILMKLTFILDQENNLNMAIYTNDKEMQVLISKKFPQYKVILLKAEV